MSGSEPLPDPEPRIELRLEADPEPVEGDPEPANDPWRALFVEFKDRDEKMMKDYQEEIDTLLVFAGLFSAVLTAFVAESYQNLQPDKTQMTLDVLRQISHQLADPSLPAVPDQVTFHAQRSDVQVNVCWFVSLLFSLVVALFGIFLKQWMRSYMKWTDVTPDRDAVSLRQFRYRALEKWRLGAILAFLPTLLQLALILFLSGLLVFLWNLDLMVAYVMVALSSIAFFLVVVVTVLPILSRFCPYRSPLSEIVYLLLWHIPHYLKIVRGTVQAFIEAGWTYSPQGTSWTDHYDDRRNWSRLLPTSWKQADEGTIARYNRSKGHITTHDDASVHLCCTTQLQPLWSAAITAIRAEHPSPLDLESKSFQDTVWWPVINHIFSLDNSDSMLHFFLVEQRCLSFSLPMKQHWSKFLLHWKRAVCADVPISVVELYLLFCGIDMQYRPSSRCALALMQVLAYHHLTLHERRSTSLHGQQLVSLLLSGSDANSWQYIPLQWDDSKTEFIEASREVSRKLLASHVAAFSGPISRIDFDTQHLQLLDIVAQLAFQAALGHMDKLDADASVPDNLVTLLRILSDGISCPTDYHSIKIVPSCARQLIFVARKRLDLFPNQLARAMVFQIEHRRLLAKLRDMTTGAEALADLSTVNVRHIMSRQFCHSSVDSRTIALVNRLIRPDIFPGILDAYEEEVLTAQAGLAFYEYEDTEREKLSVVLEGWV